METIQLFFSDPKIVAGTKLVAGLVLIIIVVKALQRVSSKYITENNFKFKARKAISFLGYLAAVIMIMLIFQVNLGGLGVALGVAGAGIAFALQEVIASFAGYVAINTANFYRIGDRVQLGGIKGDVIDIGILRTTVMEIGDWVKGDLYNGKMVRIANSFVFKEPVFNYSGDFPFLWDEITIPIKTNSDHKLARKLLTDILEKEVGAYADNVEDSWKKMTDLYLIEKARLEPMITMVFDENWITFTARFVVDFKSRRGTKDRLFVSILDAFTATEGKIEVASAAYEITAFPKISVTKN